MVVSSIPAGENSQLSPLSVITEYFCYCLLTVHFGSTIMALIGRVENEVHCKRAVSTCFIHSDTQVSLLTEVFVYYFIAV